MAAKIDPKTFSLSVNEKLQFTVDPEPTTPVSFEVRGDSTGNINAQGLYTAGSKPAGSVTVIAGTGGQVLDTATGSVTA